MKKPASVMRTYKSRAITRLTINFFNCYFPFFSLKHVLAKNKSDEKKVMKDKSRLDSFKNGIHDGVPIALGYFAVSFAFGVKAESLGFKTWQALFISLTNMTSAGQFAGLAIMAAGGALIEMVLTQIVISARYLLMSFTISQKVDDNFTTVHRMIASAFLTDEAFVIASTKRGQLSKEYFYGLVMFPYAIWLIGTVSGSLLGGILPLPLQSALGIALYAMFIAMILPPMQRDHGVCAAVIISIALSCVLFYVPWLNAHISEGFAILIPAVLSAAVIAKICPVRGDKHGW